MQADFVRSKSFLVAPAKPTVERRQGAKLHLQEGLQRGISLSHQNLGMKLAESQTLKYISGVDPVGLVWFSFCFVLFLITPR